MFYGNFPLCRFSLSTLLANCAEARNSFAGSEPLRVKKVQLSKDWSEMAIIAGSDDCKDIFI